MTTRWVMAGLAAAALAGCGDNAGAPPSQSGTAARPAVEDTPRVVRPTDAGAAPATQPASTQGGPAFGAAPSAPVGTDITTDSGLKYTIDKAGEPAGAVAKPGDLVSVHYTGTLADGKKFDSSRDRGKPIEFPLGGGMVIKGWDEGIAGMRTGEKRTLVIPPRLAYGDQPPPGGAIPRGATLKFDVELVKVSPGVKITTDREGEGAGAQPGDTAVVHYTGWIEGGPKHGQKFDSSRDKGEPFPVQLGARRVIPGWEIGLKGARKGEKRTLIIPSSLAYGERGAGDDIPPNSTLKFEIEVLEVSRRGF